MHSSLRCRWANSLAGSRWAQTNTAAVLPQTRRRSRLTNLTALPENGGIRFRILPCFISPWLMRGRGGRYFSALLEEPPEVTTLAGTLGGATGDPVGAGTVAPEPLPALVAAKESADTVRRALQPFVWLLLRPNDGSKESTEHSELPSESSSDSTIAAMLCSGCSASATSTAAVGPHPKWASAEPEAEQVHPSAHFHSLAPVLPS